MTTSVKLITGDSTVDQIELVYDASAQPNYQLQYGLNVQSEMPEVLEHISDFGDAVPIRAVQSDRVAFLRAHITGTDRDNIIDKITALKRAVDGRDSQALRYVLTRGAEKPVYLRIQLSGATNYTDALVKFGLVDDSGSHYQGQNVINVFATDVILSLRIEPVGIGAPIEVYNRLGGSPGMLQEGSTAGLAAGLTLVGSPTSYELSNNRGLIGTSQKIELPASGAVGVVTTAVSAAFSSTGAGYIWLSYDETQNLDQITVTLQDGSSNTIASTTFDDTDTSNADMTETDRRGVTWYRLSVTGTNSTAGGMQLRVVRESADASAGGVIFIDLAYLQTYDSFNLIENSAMDVDSDSDGVVDGWLFSGTGSAAISSLFYFSSPKSQEIGNLSGTSRLAYTPIYYDTSKALTVRVWVTGVTGANTLYLWNHIANSYTDDVLASVAIPQIPAGYDATTTGDDTNTWYRYSLTYTPAAGDPIPEYVQLSIEHAAGQAYIDEVAAYTDDGTTLSKVWMSNPIIFNRYKPTTAAPTNANTVDIWGVPGDQNAIMASRWSNSHANERFYWSRWSDAHKLAIERQHYFYAIGDSDWTLDGSTTSNGSWTTPTDATFNAGTKLRFTASGGTGSGTYTWESNIGSITPALLIDFVRRALLQVESSSTATQFGVKVSVGGPANRVTILETTGISVDATGALHLKDAGVLNATNILQGAKSQFGMITRYEIEFSVSAVPNSGTADFDTLWLLPAHQDDEYLFFEALEEYSTQGGNWIVLGNEQAISHSKGAIREPGDQGSLWYLRPRRGNRVMLLTADAANDLDITTATTVRFTVWPRTTHLLGVS